MDYSFAINNIEVYKPVILLQLFKFTCKYFTLSKISREQLENYAKRKKISFEETEKGLASVTAY